MPWKECHVEDERLRFVARLLEGEKMAPLCAEFVSIHRRWVLRF
jgi:putative transposase